jgi:hypothetical protein
MNGDIHRFLQVLHLLPQIGQAQSLYQLVNLQGDGWQFKPGRRRRIEIEKAVLYRFAGAEKLD